jgi:hypothetical protein
MFRASVEDPPDQIDLYGTFAEAGNELLSAAQDAMRARTWKERVPDNVLRYTEAACMRALHEIAKYRGGLPS